MISIRSVRRDLQVLDRLLGAEQSVRYSEKWTATAVRFVTDMAKDVVSFLAASSSNGKVRIENVCANLLHVMHIQMAVALVEEKQYRDCQHCNKPFELTPQVNRADRLFCSDNCRVKAYQRRKKHAIDLRREGKSLREIARTTDTDIDSVKAWVAGVKSKGESNGS